MIEDADGTTVGTKLGPKVGGEFHRPTKSCTVSVLMVVPASDFYTVTVTGGSTPITRSATVHATDVNVDATVRF